MSDESFQLWTHFEERFSQTGEVPSGVGSNEEVFRLIVRKNNARSSEALAIQGKADPLLALRAYIYRGQFAEAQALAKKLAGQADSSIRSAEIFLEQARLLAMNGDWKDCEALCNLALELPQVAPVSQLTLFQIRSLAKFETHQMMPALDDLERIESLATIFPNCPSAFYGAVLKARIVARDRSTDAGFQQLTLLWNKILSDPNANLDRVHSLIRAELDIERVVGTPTPTRLLASYRIADLTGERLYMALGAVEAAFSGVAGLFGYFNPIARDLARSFPKVQKLLDEIDEKTGLTSVTGSSLLRVFKSSQATDSGISTEELLKGLSSVTTLLLPKYAAVVHLQPFSLVRLDDQPQLKKAVLALSDGPILMKNFFARLWGRQKYSSEIHSNLISSILYRLKKTTGVKARIIDGEIRLENTWIIK